MHSVEKREIYSHWKKNSWNQLLLCKMLLSRNICQKSVRVNLRKFHTFKWYFNVFTVREFENFCLLRFYVKSIFGNFSNWKGTIFADLEALKSEYWFLVNFSSDNCQTSSKSKFSASVNVICCFLDILEFRALFSRKIWGAEKIKTCTLWGGEFKWKKLI